MIFVVVFATRLNKVAEDDAAEKAESEDDEQAEDEKNPANKDEKEEDREARAKKKIDDQKKLMEDEDAEDESSETLAGARKEKVAKTPSKSRDGTSHPDHTPGAGGSSSEDQDVDEDVVEQGAAKTPTKPDQKHRNSTSTGQHDDPAAPSSTQRDPAPASSRSTGQHDPAASSTQHDSAPATSSRTSSGQHPQQPGSTNPNSTSVVQKTGFDGDALYKRKRPEKQSELPECFTCPTALNSTQVYLSARVVLALTCCLVRFIPPLPRLRCLGSRMVWGVSSTLRASTSVLSAGRGLFAYCSAHVVGTPS